MSRDLLPSLAVMVLILVAPILFFRWWDNRCYRNGGQYTCWEGQKYRRGSGLQPAQSCGCQEPKRP